MGYILYVHRSEESTICIQSKDFESMIKEMLITIKGL